MATRHPKRPTGPKRPSKPHPIGTPASLRLDRSYAQKIRDDRTAQPFETAAKRAEFWARQQAALESEQVSAMDQSVSQISQGTPNQAVQFATANIHAATLQSAPPSVVSDQSILGPGGIAPPPPPPV